MKLYQKDGDYFQIIGFHEGKVYMKNVSRKLLNPYASCFADDFESTFAKTNMTMTEYLKTK